MRFTNSGTNVDELMGQPPTGRHAEWLGIGIYTVRDGRITSGWLAEDILGMLGQLDAFALAAQSTTQRRRRQATIVFLILGASRGLGRAISDAALNAGHHFVEHFGRRDVRPRHRVGWCGEAELRRACAIACQQRARDRPRR